MGATNLVIPQKDSSEGYEQEIDIQADGLGAAGFYPQHPSAGAPDLAAGVERDALDNLVLKDPLAGSKTLTQLLASTGITAADHKTLLQLIHFIDEGPAEGFASGATKTVTGTVFPTQILWRRADSTKLVEQNITWTGSKATTIEWKVYGTDGTTVLATVTDTISYSGVFETGRTRAIT
jgi:hypothetical protein